MRLFALSSCLVSALALAAPPTVTAPASFAGSWWGTLDAGVKLRVLFKLRHDKEWSGELISVDQGSASRPIGELEIDGDAITVGIPAMQVSYSGKRVDKDHIKGTFTQGGAQLPLDLQRGEPAARAASPVLRPQEPKPPFPYEIEQVTVDNRAAALQLGCTLTRPRAPGKFPVVVTITGSGPQDRDESILGHKPFWVLADALTRQHLGVLRCDDRGVGVSTGSSVNATTLDFAGDVEAQIAWLKTRPDVDVKHIGLLGHSEGGLIAPIVASRSKDVAFIVLLAGTGVRGEEILVKQGGLMARSQGASDEEVTAGAKLERQILDAVIANPDNALARKKMRAVWDTLPAELRSQPQYSDAAFELQAKTILSPWYRTFLALDPKPYLRKVKVPVLALDGARDIQVPPVENLAEIGHALEGNPDVTIKELPGLNHLFQTCKSCTIAEYATIEETMSPAVLQLIVEWVQKRTR